MCMVSLIPLQLVKVYSTEPKDLRDLFIYHDLSLQDLKDTTPPYGQQIAGKRDHCQITYY